MMNKRPLSLLALLTGFVAIWLLPFAACAQSLEADQSIINFGNILYGTPDSVQVTISNPTMDVVQVTEIRFYETYNHHDFSTSKNQFSIAPQGSETIWVKFDPRHNISYNSEMVILNDGKKGSLSVNLRGFGRYGSYYTATLDKSEQDLKNAFKTLLAQGYNQLSYNAARDNMFMVIHNQKVNGQGATQNTIECVYSGRTIVGYSNRQDAQNNFSDKFNTEHTWPQSLFSSALPMKSDLHHIFPTWDRANSERANSPFVVVTGTPDWQDGGSKKKGSTFEPRDKQKGVTARAMMYFVLRYQNYSSFFNNQEATLTKWNIDFPPTAQEVKRNDDVESVQGNRNPFTDYPQFAERITSFGSNSVAVEKYVLDLPEASIEFDTVYANQDVTYQYVIVNDGNKDINVSALSVSDPSLRFDMGTGANATILPGDALAMQVVLNSVSGITLSATLDFSTNIPNQASFSIPINAQVVSGVGIDILKDQPIPAFFPNPITDRFYINWKGTAGKPLAVNILDLQGRNLLTNNSLPATDKTFINLKGLPSGMYVVSLKSGERVWEGKVVVE